MTGQPTSSANAASSSGVATTRQAGQGTPRSVSRRRITALSWAWTSASGPGRTATPAASSSRRIAVGTCSWSNVTASQPRAKARTVAGSV